MNGGWIGEDGRLSRGWLPRRDTSAVREAARGRYRVGVTCPRQGCGSLLAIVRGPLSRLVVVTTQGPIELDLVKSGAVLGGCRCPQPWMLDTARLRAEAEHAGERKITVDARRVCTDESA